LARIVLEFLPPLLLTILVELTIGNILGYRKKAEMGAIILVNLITNPAINGLVFLNNHYSLIAFTLPILLGLEVLVVVAEWGMLVLMLKGKTKPLFILSLAMNACSCAVGIWIYGSP